MSFQNFAKRLLLPIACFVLVDGRVSAEDSRGIKKQVVRDREGNEIGLYRGSYALLVGVSDYTGGWPDLNSVPDELASIEGTLKSQGFVVRKVLNPASSELYSAYRDFIGDYGYEPDNRLLFFFSGHGFSRKSGTKGYLVPADAPLPDQDKTGFLRKALTMNQMLTWAREMDARHALFLFDSCFSGTIFKSRALPTYPPHISSVTARPVRQFITAGDSGETVPSKSVFAPMFVRALEGAADMSGDGYITGTELGLYLREKVISYRTGQTPQFNKIRDPDLDEGDFVFILQRGEYLAEESESGTGKEESNLRQIKEEERRRQALAREHATLLAEIERLKRERTQLQDAEELDDKVEEVVKEMEASTKANAQVEDIRIDHDVFQNGRRGIRIHTKLTINNHRSKKASVIAYFYSSDGTKLKDQNDEYRSDDGQVCTVAYAAPLFDSSTWNDYKLFIPYEELHMGNDTHALKFNIYVWDTSTDNAVGLTRSDWQHFNFTETGKRALIKDIRTDIDVFEDGKKGMRVHSHVNIKGLKSEKAEVSLYFYDEDGDKLKDSDGSYATGDGQIATHIMLTPNHDDTVWKDLKIFMPYQQLHRPQGKHSLKFYLCVWDKSGGGSTKLAESDWQSFTLTEKGKWATLDNVRVDHNVYENGKKGMRIHALARIAGLQGYEAQIAAYFHFSDGTALKDYDDTYDTTDGCVAVHKNVNPKYEETRWDDFTLFMPYDQLHLSKGKSSCKFYLTVWDHSESTSSKLTESEWVTFDYNSNPTVKKTEKKEKKRKRPVFL